MSFGGVRVRAFLPRSWQVIYPTGKKKPFAREENGQAILRSQAVAFFGNSLAVTLPVFEIESALLAAVRGERAQVLLKAQRGSGKSRTVPKMLVIEKRDT
jgi:HrpA-like RNA helicase